MTYDDPPWVFRGRAIYQLNIVKASEARKCIPAHFKLVSLFGHTLGGFYLARYDDSPVGAFDELVVLAGLVWNPPTSCAWASRVCVNNRAARDHGRAHVGLPSCETLFQALDEPDGRPEGWQHSNVQPADWWSGPSSPAGKDPHPPPKSRKGRSIRISLAEQAGRLPWKRRAVPGSELCSIQVPPADKGRKGPQIRMSLPSFSGGTAHCPQLMQYTCQLATRVGLVSSLKAQAPESSSATEDGENSSLRHVLSGKPLVALAFNDMCMRVGAPTLLPFPGTHEQPARIAALA